MREVILFVSFVAIWIFFNSEDHYGYFQTQNKIVATLNFSSTRYLKQFYNGMRWTIEDQFYTAKQILLQPNHPDYVFFDKINKVSNEQTEFKIIAEEAALRFIRDYQQVLKRDISWLAELKILEKRLDNSKYLTAMLRYGHIIGLNIMENMREKDIDRPETLLTELKIQIISDITRQIFVSDRNQNAVRRYIISNACSYQINKIFE